MLLFCAYTPLPLFFCFFLHACVLADTSSSVGQWRQTLTHVDSIIHSFISQINAGSFRCVFRYFLVLSVQLQQTS